jgi:hypothetical protein
MPTPAANPKQIDPSTIPLAVRRAAEESERKRLEHYPEPQATSEGNPEPQASSEAAPEPVPVLEPQASSEAAPQPPQGGPEPAPQPPAERGDNDESWRKQFESEVGRTRRLRKDVAALSSRIDELQALLATVQAPAPQPAPAAFEAPTLLTAEEKEEWGAVLPIMEKRFNELMAGREHQLQGEIESLKARLEGQGQQVQQSARMAMYHFMDTHPVLGLTNADWREVNDDRDFVEWLKYPDVMSGRTRLSLLQEAHNTNDAQRFAAIFESFLRETGRLPAPAAAQTNGSGSASHEPPASGNGLERFAAPGPARSAPVATGTPAGQEFFTTGDISRYYTDLRLGRWKGREKEAADYERRFIVAGREGRVRPGNPSP